MQLGRGDGLGTEFKREHVPTRDGDFSDSLVLIGDHYKNWATSCALELNQKLTNVAYSVR